MKHSLLVLGLAAGFSGQAAAAPLPEDFARALIIDATGESAIYEIAIPESVYLTTTRADLGDIRVFNAAGEIVPHAIRRAPAASPAEERLSVPFFPVLPDGGTAQPGIDGLADGEEGVVQRLSEREGAVFVESADIGAYVIDLDKLGGRVESLDFELARAPENYVKKARLEQSGDLNDWSMLVPEATLVRLQRGPRVLEKTLVELAGQTQRYVRFSWIEHDGTTQIVKVFATIQPLATAVASRREWRVLDRLAAGDEPGTMQFDSGGSLPVDRLRLLFPEPNFALDVRVESRARDPDPWRARHAGLFYELRVNDQIIETGPVAISASTDRYWRVHYGVEDDPALRDARLNVGWSASQLLFLARGKDPFTVAFGSANVEPPERPTQALLDALERGGRGDLVTSAAVREETVLSGEEALEKRIRVDRRKLILWGILIGGVALLAFLALRLSRQMRGSGATGPAP